MASGANLSNSNSNNEFIKVSQNNSSLKKINGSLTYINVIPNDTQKFTENKDISRKVSSKPNSIFNLLVTEDEIYGKRFKGIPVYLSRKIEKIDYGNGNDEYEIENTIYINNELLSQIYSQPFTNNIMNFMRSQSQIFVGFIKNQRLKNIPKTFDHMNSFIIDKHNKKVILFEPKGQRIHLHPSFLLSRVNLLEIIISDLITNGYQPEIFDGYEFISTTESASKTKIGKFLNIFTKMPQTFDIYCQTYSLYAVLLYCLNHAIVSNASNASNINKLFNTITQKKILAFQNFLSTQLLKPEYIENSQSLYNGNEFENLMTNTSVGGSFLTKRKKHFLKKSVSKKHFLKKSVSKKHFLEKSVSKKHFLEKSVSKKHKNIKI